jgi:hypothetical protein
MVMSRMQLSGPPANALTDGKHRDDLLDQRAQALGNDS